jgi:ribosomal protein S1
MTTNDTTIASVFDEIQRKAHYSGRVIKTTLAGAIVDIGLDIPGVVHISQIQKEPVNRVEDVLQVGQTVDVWVRRVFPNKKRIDLTMIKPLGLEWREIKKDMIVRGKVTRLERFGVFVDIGAERPGLVHVSEITHGYIRTPEDIVKEGDDVEVKVLGVNRQKKQIKLSMKALEEPPVKAIPKPPKEPPGPEKEKNEPIPTSMEFAFREAMESAQARVEETEEREKPKRTGRKSELEDILSRTLEHKEKSGAKK